MTDWILSILATPYMVTPIVAWLWKQAKFPELNWKKIFLGVALTFAASILQTFSISLANLSSNDGVLWIVSLTHILGSVSNLLGLFIIGLYVIIGSFSIAKF